MSTSESRELKSKILELLKEDEEFRYAVAGLIGLNEILRRFEEYDKHFLKIWKEIERLRKEMSDGFKQHSELLEKHWQEIQKLREDMNKGFKRHDEMFERHWKEIERLREDMLNGFKRHDEILEKHWQEIQKLREDMNRGFEMLRRHIDALGARWGIMSEEAFREGLKSIVEKEFGYKVERWVRYDEEGYVFRRPSMIEIDLAMHDKKLILIEVSSHTKSSDIYILKRKAEFFEKIEGRKPDRILVVTPYIDKDALEMAGEFGIEVYTKV